MKTGIELIAEERQEQINKHGFDLLRDIDFYQLDELSDAAMFAITLDEKYYPKTWDRWFANKMYLKGARMEPNRFAVERRKIAGALLAAEIDRIQSLRAIEKIPLTGNEDWFTEGEIEAHNTLIDFKNIRSANTAKSVSVWDNVPVVFDGTIIEHRAAPETYGGVAVKTAFGNFAITKEGTSYAINNIGKVVKCEPVKQFYATVRIICA